MTFIILILCILVFISVMYYNIYFIYTRKQIIKRWFNRKKAILYKRKKIKQSIIDESDYVVKFNVVLKDQSGNHKFVDVLDITIPARAAFFARKKLQAWLMENITMEIIDIKLKEPND